MTTSVRRDSVPKDVPVSEMVPGDVVLLSAGGMVPADARVLEARDFFVKQALLTSEPYPVEVHPGEPVGQKIDVGSAPNTAFTWFYPHFAVVT